MQPESLSLREIDVICSRFEQEWSSAGSAESLWEFVCAKSPAANPSFELYCELVQIDLELRWRQLAKSLEDVDGDKLPENLALPSVSEYLEHDSMKSLQPELSRLLSNCDLKCRLRYGDVPSHREYSVPESALELLLQLMPVATVRYQANVSPFNYSFWSPLLIGRQSIDEPEPTIAISSPRHKLIVTDVRDTTISRQQLEVRVIAGTFAKVCNNSSNRYFKIEKYDVVGPGSELLVRFPFTVSLSTITIEFRRDSLAMAFQ